MIIKSIQELEATKAKVAALEEQIASELKAELLSLPGRYGFPDVNSFLAAVQKAGGKRRGRKPGSVSAPAKTGRRRRAKITDATREEVKKLVEAGKTGTEIAKAVKISLPSVQNIKKALGLVKKSKK
jgi:hypothetical protein